MVRVLILASLLFVTSPAPICTADQIDPKLDFEAAQVTELREPEMTASKERPNIRGVRVIVETSKGGSPESKSSETDSSSSSGSSDRSSVGVRTDVTFEISGESNETLTSGEIPRRKPSARGGTKNDTSSIDRDVPIVLGRKPADVTTWKPLVHVIPSPEDKSRGWFKNLPPFMWTTERVQYDPNIAAARGGKWHLICCTTFD